MPANSSSAPAPDLRIVPTDQLYAHEEHDTQRALPLVERLRTEPFVINPPIAAQMTDDSYVILDGANRCYAFAQLKYPHSLVQVVSYEDGTVELGTWQHVVGDWDENEFIQQLRNLPDIRLEAGDAPNALARVALRSGLILSLHASVETTHERNAALRHVVGLYQRNATLHRTANNEPSRVWPLFPNPIALVSFPHYRPQDIIAAAQEQAFLPPGVSRHIVHGRAIRVNYPIAALRDTSHSLAEKNEALAEWVRRKMANRQVRYYAESTYQFDE